MSDLEQQLHARLGEVLYISTTSADRSISTTQTLSRSVKHFLRSLELCDDYVRGLYGLIMVRCLSLALSFSCVY